MNDTVWSIQKIKESRAIFSTAPRYNLISGLSEDSTIVFKEDIKQNATQIEIYFIDSVNDTFVKTVHFCEKSGTVHEESYVDLDKFVTEYNGNISEAVLETLLRLSNLIFDKSVPDIQNTVVFRIGTLLDIVTPDLPFKYLIFEKFYKESSEDNWSTRIIGLWADISTGSIN